MEAFRAGGEAVQVFPEDNVDALEESIRVVVLGRELRLTLLMVMRCERSTSGILSVGRLI